VTTSEIAKPIFVSPNASETPAIKARRLLRSASNAAEHLETDVCELVTMRAWEVLGYTNFAEMWHGENGLACPTHVKALATVALAAEGMNTNRGRTAPNGHTLNDIADAVGFPNSGQKGRHVAGVLAQLRHGVPVDEVSAGGWVGAKARIAQYGDKEFTSRYRSRLKPRRMGKTDDELVNVSMNLPKRDTREIEEIARNAAVPNAEIYRQAVAEYLARYRASRMGGEPE
jgi:hypothetical protein